MSAQRYYFDNMNAQRYNFDTEACTKTRATRPAPTHPPTVEVRGEKVFILIFQNVIVAPES